MTGKNFLASASTTGAPWLQVTPNSGTTPATLTVSIVPQAVSAAGIYSGLIQVAQRHRQHAIDDSGDDDRFRGDAIGQPAGAELHIDGRGADAVVAGGAGEWIGEHAVYGDER